MRETVAILMTVTTAERRERFKPEPPRIWRLLPFSRKWLPKSSSKSKVAAASLGSRRIGRTEERAWRFETASQNRDR